MVGRAEGAALHESTVVAEAGDGVDLGGLECFVEGHLGEDGEEPLAEHGLAGAWRAHEEQVVAPGGCDLERPLGLLLAGDVGEVEGVVGGRDQSARDDGQRRLMQAAEEANHLLQPGAADRLDAVHQRGLGGILGRDDEAGEALVAGGDGHGEDAAHGPELAVERELSDHKVAVETGEFVLFEETVCRHRGEGDGEVEAGAIFAHIGGGEVDADAALRPGEAGVFEGRLDPHAGLADGALGEAYNEEGLNAWTEVDLDRDGDGIDADDAAGLDAREHDDS